MLKMDGQRLNIFWDVQNEEASDESERKKNENLNVRSR